MQGIQAVCNLEYNQKSGYTAARRDPAADVWRYSCKLPPEDQDGSALIYINTVFIKYNLLFILLI